ncbi:MAG: hypothetical protein ACTHW1_11160 [Ancrocorticia sp.]|uniref:hypothetical protein n=1 Tax=Ancrocorticia sp. TaxID=2593684 RepID=UPI003F92D6D1
MYSSSSHIARAITRAALPQHAVIAIDGRTGAGKTRFAGMLAGELASHGPVTIMEVERFIEGWSGLVGGTATLAEDALPDFRADGACRLRAWDWIGGTWGHIERVPAVGTARILILVGCGSSSKELAPLLDGSVWIDAPASLRRQRVELREGAGTSWWDMWEAQHTELLTQWDSPVKATWRIRNQ